VKETLCDEKVAKKLKPEQSIRGGVNMLRNGCGGGAASSYLKQLIPYKNISGVNICRNGR